MTTDPVARALAQVEREANEAGVQAMQRDDSWVVAERDVWKAAAERYLRALDATKLPLLREAARLIAACFPPEREEMEP